MRRPYAADDNRRRLAGQVHRGFEIHSTAQGRGQGGDDRIAGTGHIVNLARMGGKMPRRAIPWDQSHAVPALGYQQSLQHPARPCRNPKARQCSRRTRHR